MILANSLFTARVFKSFFPSIKSVPRVIYPGIHLAAYEAPIDLTLPEVIAISSYAHIIFFFFPRYSHKKLIILVLDLPYFLSIGSRRKRILFLLLSHFR